jgi:hypothetical protein
MSSYRNTLSAEDEEENDEQEDEEFNEEEHIVPDDEVALQPSRHDLA